MSEVDHGLSLRRNGSWVTTDASTTSAVITDSEIVSDHRRAEAEAELELELSSDDEREEDRVEEDKMIKVDSLMQIRRWVKRQIKYFTPNTTDASTPISCRVIRSLDKIIVWVDNVIDLLDEKRRRGFPKYEQRRAQRRRLRRAAARTVSKIFDGHHDQEKSTNSENGTLPSPTPTLLAPQRSPSDQARTRSKSSLNQRPAFKSKSTSLCSRKKSTKIHRCHSCRKTFTSKSALTKHRFIHEKDKAVAKGGRRHGCYFCDARFESPSRLASHLLTHTKEKPFRCPQCGNEFTRNAHLTIHQRSHSANPRPFTCPECDKTFTQKYHMLRHKKMLHQNLKDVKCPKCRKKFSTRCNMTTHLNFVHLKIKHPCPHCTDNANVRKHTRKCRL